MSDWLAWQVVDSAFPVGVFAHSWGLESAWQSGHVPDVDALHRFLHASIQQTGYGVLPLLGAAYHRPEELAVLDELADAFLTNSVTNRASRVQGRTLVATAARIWPSDAMTDLVDEANTGRAHVAPLSGRIFQTIGLPLDTARRVTLYGTARGVLSAAVRLGIVGSYQAQQMQHQAAPWLDTTLERSRGLGPEDICQTAPIIDLLQAGHDRLYSRLFQS
ncbi:MAG: urease accessory UreF family protein [bacterium]